MQNVYVYYRGNGTEDWFTAPNDKAAKEFLQREERAGSAFCLPLLIQAAGSYWLPKSRLYGSHEDELNILTQENPSNLPAFSGFVYRVVDRIEDGANRGDTFHGIYTTLGKAVQVASGVAEAAKDVYPGDLGEVGTLLIFEHQLNSMDKSNAVYDIDGERIC